MLEKMLLADGAALAECQTQQGFAGERADPDDALRRIGLEREARRGNGDWRPILHRLLQTRLDPRAAADRPASIFGAVGDQRPAVIMSAQNEIELIAALRTMLVGPELAPRCIEGEALRIAMAVAPDLRPRADPEAKRIVLGDRAVGADADDRAEMIGEVLCRLTKPSVAEGEKEIAVRRECDASTDLIGP